MSEWFKLTNEEFSPIYQENQWTYSCLFPLTFKKWTITKITITDHYQQEHPEITNELILNLLKEKIHGRRKMKPRTRHGIRDIYVRERISYDGKKYRLIFWFKDGTNNHLWVRNCHPQD